jgi:TPP-dependent indolepyruvate ferredoxin oxidoreductase alpha subunit
LLITKLTDGHAGENSTQTGINKNIRKIKTNKNNMKLENIQLTKEESAQYMQIVKTSNMDDMFDFGRRIEAQKNKPSICPDCGHNLSIPNSHAS